MKQIVIAGGGERQKWPALQCFLPEETFWVGVDRGAFFLIEMGIAPNLAVGDFDSLSEEELARLKEKTAVHESVAEKDDTDTQLALLDAVTLHPELPVYLIGMTGGRIDHFLSNFWMPLEPRFQPFMQQIIMLDDQNEIRYFPPGSYTLPYQQAYRYVAFAALTAVESLTLSQVKYPLFEVDVPRPTSLASNEFLPGLPAEFSFESGVLAVIYSRDEKKAQ